MKLGSTAKELLGAIGVVAIAVAALSIALGSPRRLVEELASVDPWALLASIALLMLVEVAKAARLCVLADKGLGSMRACLLARLLGRAAASVTPAGLGGIPTRTAVLASEARIEFGRAFGAAAGETLADNSVALLALFAGAALGVMNLVVLAVAALIAFLWVTGIVVGVHERTITALYRRFHITGTLRCSLERERRAALQALGILLKPRRAALVYAYTLAAHALEYASVLVFTGTWGDPRLWLHSILAVEAGYLMIFTPAPGGGGGVEYALVSYLGPRLALYWRISYLIAALTPLALAYIVYPGFKEYLGDYRAASPCDDMEHPEPSRAGASQASAY